MPVLVADGTLAFGTAHASPGAMARVYLPWCEEPARAESAN